MEVLILIRFKKENKWDGGAHLILYSLCIFFALFEEGLRFLNSPNDSQRSVLPPPNEQ